MPTNDINDACKKLRDEWPGIQTDFIAAVPGHYLVLDCVYRSPEEQFELFKKGRVLTEFGTWIVKYKDEVVTNVDGYKIIGAHNYNPSRAIDCCVMNNQTGERCWDEKWYARLIVIADQHGLVDGGSWRTLKDFPHLEVKDFKNYKES